ELLFGKLETGGSVYVDEGEGGLTLRCEAAAVGKDGDADVDVIVVDGKVDLDDDISDDTPPTGGKIALEEPQAEL
ncbi:MAG: hypothetical protein ACRD3W_12870, partial [Terriglobales bacterium]